MAYDCRNYADVELNFDGSNCEKKMMEKLLRLMDQDDSDEEELDYLWSLPVRVYRSDHLSELWGSGVWFISFEAPKLFAALFPSSRFQYSISITNDDSCGDNPVLTAVYEDGKLMMSMALRNITNPTYKRKAADLCRKIYKTTPPSKEKLKNILKAYDISEEVLLGESTEENEHTNWSGILEELIGSSEAVLSLFDFYEDEPSRDSQYERSFFEGEDLQVYLVEEQMKNKDMSLAEYIKGFSFTEEQFQAFIQASAECGFNEMTAFLLEEKHKRFSKKELQQL